MGPAVEVGVPLEEALPEALLELGEHRGGVVEARAVSWPFCTQAAKSSGTADSDARRSRACGAARTTSALSRPRPLRRPFVENERAARREQRRELVERASEIVHVVKREARDDGVAALVGELLESTR